MGVGHAHGHARGRRSRPYRIRWRRLWATLAVLAAAGYVATGLYTVEANERVVVRRFGRAVQHVSTPGLHFGLPWGFDKITRLKARQTKRVGVGLSLSDRTLGRRGSPREAEMLTGDSNLILVSGVVQYTISDPKAYLFAAADVPALVRDVASAELTRIISHMKVDDVLTARRDTIRQEARRAIQAQLTRYAVGVVVQDVLLPSDAVSPPAEVAQAFRDVTSAREDKQRAVNVAEGYRKRIVPEAHGQAYRIRSEASAFAQEVVAKATGDRDRFLAEARQLGTGRELTARRLILETLEEVLPRLKKIVLDDRTRGQLDLGLIEGR